MLFGKPLKPRRFEFFPTKGVEDEEPHRIKFRHIRRCDPRDMSRLPVKYIIFLLVIGALFLWLGGHRHVMRPVEITVEDAAAATSPADMTGH